MGNEPRPLSKERLEHIERLWCQQRIDPQTCEELLLAEQYWREAVKGIYPEKQYDSSVECVFCHEETIFPYTEDKHKPDCPWLLAQG